MLTHTFVLVSNATVVVTIGYLKQLAVKVAYVVRSVTQCQCKCPIGPQTGQLGSQKTPSPFRQRR